MRNWKPITLPGPPQVDPVNMFDSNSEYRIQIIVPWIYNDHDLQLEILKSIWKTQKQIHEYSKYLKRRCLSYHDVLLPIYLLLHNNTWIDNILNLPSNSYFVILFLSTVPSSYGSPTFNFQFTAQVPLNAHIKLNLLLSRITHVEHTTKFELPIIKHLSIHGI